MPADKKASADIARAIADGDPIDWVNLKESGSVSEKEAAAFQALEMMRCLQKGGRGSGGAASPGDELRFDEGFEVFEELGKGARSRVYRARDKAHDREVALKVLRIGHALSEQERSCFLEELRTLASLNHPNIVRVYAIDEYGGGFRVCLERVRGRTLSRAMIEDGPFPEEQAARIVADLCRIIDDLHARGIVYRDLKSSNVMLAEDGRLVLLDFGLAHVIGPEDLKTVRDMAETLTVMAPEQYTSADVLGPGVDVYALGVLLYWMVSGRYPFEAEGFYALRDRVLSGKAVPLKTRSPGVSRAYVRIASKAMALRPKDRFVNAARLGEALLQRDDTGNRFSAFWRRLFPRGRK